jgi:N-terminal acetyltransferase B complex non-catalytic subunit
MKDEGGIKATLERTDRHPADDLCVLSATCLVKLSEAEQSFIVEAPLETHTLSRLLQAAVLLEFASSQSKPNSQILFMLTRLYTMLGCGSLAYSAYKRLATKQIQHASLSYQMFDGISSLHPHPFPSEASDSDSTPHGTVIEELRGHQKVYKTAVKSTLAKSWSAFEHNSYNTILELEDFKNAITFNMSVVMSVIESRRVSRLTQPNVQLTATSGGYDILRKHILGL